jgi:hypothetical protein
MFPSAGANIYRNEAGEPTGWDSGDNDGPYEPDDYLNDYEDDEDDEDDQPESHLPIDPATGRESTGADEIETASEADHEDDEPDDAETSWQEYGHEVYSDVEQGRYDDDPSPYDGNYSEM